VSAKDIKDVAERILRDARASAKSGFDIIDRGSVDEEVLAADSGSIRNAATQFRQAAKELDQLDGMIQAKYWMERK
jgi:hypothetical protein